MRRATHGVALAMLLILAGLAIFSWKVNTFGYPVFPDESSHVWTVQALVPVSRGGNAIKVDLQLPTRTPGYAISDEHFISRGFGVALDEDPWQRTATWSIRRSDSLKKLYYRAVFFEHSDEPRLAPTPRFPQRPVLDEPFNTALLKIVDEVREESADVETFTAQVLVQLNDPAPEDNMALFLDGPLGLEPVQIARMILAAARIPSLTIHGIQLVENALDAPVITYLAVHNGKKWLYFDPATGVHGLPDDFLVWWTGDEPLATAQGATLGDIEISVRQQVVSALSLASDRAEVDGSRVTEFSLLALPVNLQSVYEILLLVPVGAFIIVLLRSVVGLRSFGTFMPVLIALAFRETQLVAGLLLFTVIVGFGLLIRFYLEKLRLLLVPRLAAVLIIVVILMAVISVVSHRMDIDAGLSVALFPIVIIAMVIERMSIVWEEHGPANALLDGVGSLAIAAIAYVVMGIDLFGWWVLVFPELLLVLLGLTLMLGRYTGYRLTELFRFRELT